MDNSLEIVFFVKYQIFALTFTEGGSDLSEVGKGDTELAAIFEEFTIFFCYSELHGFGFSYNFSTEW